MKSVANAFRILLKPLAALYCGLEYAVLLAPCLGALRRAEYVYPMWVWSFGHQASDPHLLAMRFHGKELLIILSDYGQYNRHIADSMRPYVKIVTVRHTSLAHMLAKHVLRTQPTMAAKRAVIRFWQRIVRGRAEILKHFFQAWGSRLSGIFLNEYLEQIAISPISVLTPSQPPLDEMRSFLENHHPTWNGRWFVSLYLRRKSTTEKDVRDTDPTNYLPLVRRILERGGAVFCGGDFAPADIGIMDPLVLGYEDMPADRHTVDFFFLTQCRFMVGAHSGPLPVCTAFGVPVLITNNAFFYLSGYRADHRVFFKDLKDVRTGRMLTASEMFSQPIVEYHDARHFSQAGLVHVDNTPEQLADAVDEMLALVVDGKNIATDEDDERERRWRKMLPDEAHAKRSPCRPSVGYLRHILPDA